MIENKSLNKIVTKEVKKAHTINYLMIYLIKTDTVIFTTQKQHTFKRKYISNK